MVRAISYSNSSVINFSGQSVARATTITLVSSTVTSQAESRGLLIPGIYDPTVIDSSPMRVTLVGETSFTPKGDTPFIVGWGICF